MILLADATIAKNPEDTISLRERLKLPETESQQREMPRCSLFCSSNIP